MQPLGLQHISTLVVKEEPFAQIKRGLVLVLRVYNLATLLQSFMELYRRIYSDRSRIDRISTT